MWGNLLNQRKIVFFDAIKSQEMATIYKDFMKINEIFVLRKFKEKYLKRNTKNQNKAKPHN